jgi:hypothetical protein
MVKVVFCLPGKTYSREFLLSWTDLVMQTASRGHQVAVSQQPTLEKCVAPISGTEYDVAMLIGCDIVFRPDDFFGLLESPHDVTTGLYLKEPTLASPDPVFEGTSLTPSDVGDEQYIDLETAPFGFMLLRKGVIEANDASLWSQSTFNGEVHADTKIRVGHRVEIVI